MNISVGNFKTIGRSTVCKENDVKKLTWSQQPGRAGGKVDTRQIKDDKTAT